MYSSNISYLGLLIKSYVWKSIVETINHSLILYFLYLVRFSTVFLHYMSVMHYLFLIYYKHAIWDATPRESMSMDGLYNIMSPDPISDNRSDWSGFGKGCGIVIGW